MLGAGVALATAVGYLFVSVLPTQPGDRAALALALPLVSLVAFALALRWSSVPRPDQ